MTFHKITSAIIFTLIAAALLTACAPLSPDTTYQFSLPGQASLLLEIKIEDGSVEVRSSSDEDIHIHYLDTANKELITIRQEDERFILQTRSAYTAPIQIEVPTGIQLRIEAYHAHFSLMDVSGMIHIQTTDGDIHAADSSGRLTLRSARGNVSIRDSHGDIALLGEHGVLEITNTHGDVDAATIMGTIQFQGQLEMGDDIFLETDHGPVFASLSDMPDTLIHIWTANGKVTCMLDDVTSSNITCDRPQQDATSSFQIKTVWGNIRVEEQ